MIRQERSRAGAPDYILLFILFALLSVGFLMVFSTSPTLGMRAGDIYLYLRRHIFYLVIGLSALVFGLRTDYHQLKKAAPFVLSGVFVLLFLLFLPGIGRTVGGSVRWIDISILAFQPSEIAKFAVVLYLAAVLSSWNGLKSEALKIFLIAIVPVFALSLLILKQPDLGTTIVVLGATFALLFISNFDLSYLAAIGVAGLAGVAALSLTSAYRFKRILAFLNPWSSPLDVGFQIIQSLYAVGSGGIFGLGLGGSRQKFFYLPQNYTDFIFSIISEELGFLGACGVIILLLMFIARGIRIAKLSRDNFGALLAGGIVSWIAIQSVMNIYVVTGVFPTTGIPLPFISFGGTALVVTLYSVGVLLNISKNLPPAAEEVDR